MSSPAERPATKRFSRQNRLEHKRQFDKVFQDGRAFWYPEICVRAIPNGLAASRLGLSVSRRAGGAVCRNRIKRVLREAFRLNLHRLTVSVDIVLVPRREWRSHRLSVVEPSFIKALDEIGKVFSGR